MGFRGKNLSESRWSPDLRVPWREGPVTRRDDTKRDDTKRDETLRHGTLTSRNLKVRRRPILFLLSAWRNSEF